MPYFWLKRFPDSPVPVRGSAETLAHFTANLGLQPSSRTMVACWPWQLRKRQVITMRPSSFCWGSWMSIPPWWRAALLTLLMPFAEAEPQRWIQIIKGVLDSCWKKSGLLLYPVWFLWAANALAMPQLQELVDD